jgi:hypothetical protein
MGNPLDIRQSSTRILQDQLNLTATAPMDSTLASINNELTAPGRLIAATTPSLVVTVGPNDIVNPNTEKNRVLPFIDGVLSAFPGGTITFPSTSGTIVVSPGVNESIIIGANQYVSVLVQLTSSGNISLLVSTAASSIAAAQAALIAPSTNNLPLGYIIVESNGSGIIQNITDAMLYQFTDRQVPVSSSSSSVGWVAQDISLSSGATSVTVTFTNPQTDTSFVIFAMMENQIDATPKFQQVEVTAKSKTGFTAQWNVPLDTNNYTIAYIIPPKWAVVAETALSSGSSSFTIPLLIPQNGTNYGIVSQLQNLTDTYPQFQTTVIDAQTSSSFTTIVDDPTLSTNYQLAWLANPTAQVSIGSGITSKSITLPVSYGSTNYVLVASLSDTDVNPQQQPLLVTAKGSSGFIISWNAPTSSADYLLTYYALPITT